MAWVITVQNIREKGERRREISSLVVGFESHPPHLLLKVTVMWCEGKIMILTQTLMAGEGVKVSLELPQQVLLGDKLGKSYIVDYVNPVDLVTVPATYYASH